jgi:hypothetical protein
MLAQRKEPQPAAPMGQALMVWHMVKRLMVNPQQSERA